MSESLPVSTLFIAAAKLTFDTSMVALSQTTVADVTDHFNIDQLAFSGGVFQNALLVDLLIQQLAAKKHLYFHQQLSSNDECIGFGQLACYQISQQTQPPLQYAAASATAIS